MFGLFVRFYFILFIGVLLYVLFGLVAQNTWLNKKLEEDRANDLSGTVFMLEKMYRDLGEDELIKLFDDYPKASNIPVKFFHINELDLLPDSEVRLRAGEKLTDRNLATYNSPRDIALYYNFPNSEIVIGVGPLGRGEELDNIVTIYEKSIFLVVALPMIVIMLSLLYKLKHLERASIRIGNGDFSARVSEINKHKIGKLNKSFNSMAARVERLIKGHKELTNAIAHELRTPISRIRFELDMMGIETDVNIRKEYMFGISDDIDELANLVDELLTYARFDREATALELKTHSLDESLQHVIDERHFNTDKLLTYDNKWAEFITQINPIRFDPKLLERAIGNLVSNAEKYSYSTVQISVKRSSQQCCIYIDDDGPGIPSNERINIFTPFKRLDNSRTRATGGFGLGLAIVKQIAQWHGGDVTIDDSPLGGARFIFTWST
jgi:signal transduction histidine kinase